MPFIRNSRKGQTRASKTVSGSPSTGLETRLNCKGAKEFLSWGQRKYDHTLAAKLRFPKLIELCKMGVIICKLL